MKLFFIIFSAILAAAAVIWTVYSHNVAEEKRAATTLSLMQGSMRLTRLSLERAMAYTPDERDLKSDLTTAQGIEVTLKGIKRFNTRVDRFAIRSLVEDSVSNLRQVVAIVREKMPGQKTWLEDMEAALARIEAEVKS